MTETDGALPAGVRLRPTRDADAEGWIELIATVFGEYEGCVLDVELEEPELLAPATRFEAAWVLEAEGRVIGAVAMATRTDPRGRWVELEKCYLERAFRGRGLGRVLVNTVESAARAAGVDRVILWSDTRFLQAHTVYEHLGYRRTGAERELHDLSGTREFEYEKSLGTAQSSPT